MMADPHFSDSVFVADETKLGNNPQSKDGQVNGITSMEWAPDGANRLYLTIKGRANCNAMIQVVNNGVIQSVPFYTFNSGLETHNECGLLSLAFHPDYAAGTKQLYCFVTVSSKEQQIVRFDEVVDAKGNFIAAGPPTPIVKGLPTNGEIHNGGAVVVAPDQNGKGHYLYWSCGNNGTDRGAKLDNNSLGSKIGRANLDGSIPTDGLNASGYIWAYGYRNPFSMSVQPATGKIWVNVVGEVYEQVIMPAPGSWAGDKDYEAGGIPNDPALRSRQVLPMFKYKTGGIDTRQLAQNNGAMRNGNVVTFTTTVPHRFLKGEKISLSGISPASFNGFVYVQSTPTDKTFTAELAGTDIVGAGGTAVTQNVGNCVMGGAFYNKSAWPKEYAGNFFFGDYGSGRMTRLQLNTDNTVRQVDSFLTNGGHISDCSFGPDGQLYYALIDAGAIHKVTYTALLIDTESTLRATTIGVNYQQKLNVTGATPPLKWALASGKLPKGLTINNEGVVSGAADDQGDYKFSLSVDDSAKNTGIKEFNIAISQIPYIFTDRLPGGRAGFAYEQILKSRDGLAPRTWSVKSGTLPAGLKLDFAKGSLTGKPSEPGKFTFAIELKDAVGAATSRDYSIKVTRDNAEPVVVSEQLPAANVGSQYSAEIKVNAYPEPTFTLTSAPAGMTIDAKTGVLTWLPKKVGKVDIAVKAVNGIKPSAEHKFSLDVEAFGLVARPVAKLNMGLNPAAPPATLSATNIFTDVARLKSSSALVAYTVNSPLWSDGAAKIRWIAVPSTGLKNETPKIGFSANGEWKFPAGTVLVKHFDLNSDERNIASVRRLETRLMFVQPDGTVLGVTYKWRADGSDADLQPDGSDEDIQITAANGSTRTQRWHYPSRAECLQCHTTGAGGVLGIKTRQLNGDFTYPDTGNTDNQIRSWSHAGLFDKAPEETAIASLPRLAPLNDAKASPELRVRSYIDANCAHCHRPGGAPAVFDARFDTPSANQNIINGRINKDLGIKDAKNVAARDPSHSVLVARMTSLDPAVRMPQLAHNIVDTEAVALIEQWINGLTAGSGLTGEYFSTPDLTQPKLSRVDPAVDFEWGSNSPHPDLDAAKFSVRWTGEVMAQFNETYTFYTKSDDGARLWVDGKQLINEWHNQGSTEWKGEIELSAGKKYSIKMEYFQNGGDASAKLFWSSPSTPKTIVPQMALYPVSK